MPATIRTLLAKRAADAGTSEAILAPGRPPLPYGGLADLVDRTARSLKAAGIRRNDRVAVVLPNGPEMAAAFLSVSSVATCAPLNPAYHAEEFDFYLSDLNAAAVIVQRGGESPVREAARARGIAIIELSPTKNAPAGTFTLDFGAEVSGEPTFAEADDIALVLHTSGTTSRPKIVPLTHANLVSSALHIRRALELTSEDRCLNVMPLFHIHGLIGAVLSTVAAGGSIVCTPGFQAPKFFGWIDEFHPTWYTAVPTMHQAILARAQSNREILGRNRLRFVRSSSAALPPVVMKNIEEAFQAPVIESYGMTEASHQMASNPLPPGKRKPGSVGLAAGPEIAIMKDNGTLLDVGSVGEVVIRGPNVTSGYENNPVANQSAFTGGWFCTGDQGYLDEDGYLFLTGRLKEIINRGGEKISPREIDEVLLEHPAVEQAVAFALPDDRLGEDVAAAVVLRPGSRATGFELRDFAASRLADFKVPRRIVILEEIPKGPTGKLQRIGLAEKFGLTGESSGDHRQRVEYREPATPSEKLVSRLFQEVLGIERAGADDNFFNLGGDSVLAAMFLAHLKEQTGAELSVVRLFESSEVREIAKWLDSSSEERTPAGADRILPRPSDTKPAVSFTQQRMWFLDRFEEEKATLNRPAVFRLKGELHFKALERGINRILERHEVLRTNYRLQDNELTAMVAVHQPFQISLADVTALPESERDVQVKQLVRKEARRVFDLERDLMLRAVLVRLASKHHLLVVTMHHIASDGWSSQVFLRELTELYNAYARGTEPKLARLPIQYADFAHWQNRWLSGPVLEKLLEWWKEQLSGEIPVLELPTDRPRQPRRTHAGARKSVLLPKELLDALNSLSQREGVTLFMLLLAAFKVLLYRYTGAEDLVVGVPVAGRTQPETETLIGPFINTLALRSNLSGAPAFREFLNRVRQVTLGALAHQDLPFEKLVEALNPDRQRTDFPLFQVLFQLRNVPPMKEKLHGLKLEELDIDPGLAELDLVLETQERADGLYCFANYNTDLFDAPTIERMLDHYRTLLENIVENPEQRISHLPLLTETERHRMLVEWNGTHVEVPKLSIQQLFERQVARTPERIAVTWEGGQLSYGALNERSNRLARYLRHLGVGPEVFVAICVERSADMIIGILGVLKAGGVFVPFNPDDPVDRLRFLIDDAEPAIIVTKQRHLPRLRHHRGATVCLDTDWERIARESGENLPCEVRLDNAVYMIYTSGTTGKPKGVVLLHGGLVSTVAGEAAVCPLVAEDRVLQMTAFTFDVAVDEILPPLTVGACVVLAAPGGEKDPSYLVQVMEREKVTRVHVVSSLLQALLAEEAFRRCRYLRLVDVGGEAVPTKLQDRFFQESKATLYNFYGPTETTMLATWWKCRPGTRSRLVPIGFPLPNKKAYVLDRNLQLVPAGVPGVLYIGGSGLARGYWKRPDLTAERFVPDPFGEELGARMYRTGDLVRRLPDGALEFLGREDDQVKVRGLRIELGEIESAIAAQPGVKQAAVITYETSPLHKVLTAYIVRRTDATLSEGTLRAALAGILPRYMVPTRFVFLDRLPVLPSGKIDRQALPPPSDPAEEPVHPAAPATPTVEIVTGIWREILKRNTIPTGADFFSLGGDSLSAARLLARVRETFRTTYSLQDFFEAPTIAAMAARILPAAEAPIQTIPRRGTTDPCPLSFAQRRLWFLEQLEPNSPKYIIFSAQRWKGPLDPAVLEEALNSVIARHEILRTTFHDVAGKPVQMVSLHKKLRITLDDLTSVPTGRREEEARVILGKELKRPFDLSRDLPLRARLLRLDEQAHIFVVAVHHIVTDGWSMSVLFQEVAEFYTARITGKAPELPELPIQYADFAVWQLQSATEERLTRDLAYWKKQLVLPLPRPALPSDRSGSESADSAGGGEFYRIPASVTTDLTAIAKDSGATFFTVITAAFMALLHRLTGEQDLLIGTVMAGREQSECANLIGCFANTVVLRANYSGAPTFLEWLDRVRPVVAEAQVHQNLPFEKLVEELNPPRQPYRNPLFDVMFEFHDRAWQTAPLEGVQLQPYGVVNPLARFPLTLHCVRDDEGLSLKLLYWKSLFSRDRALRILDEFHRLLKQIAADPETPIPSASQTAVTATPSEPASLGRAPEQSVEEMNQPDTDLPLDQCAHELFEAQVRRTPGAMAAVFEEERLTFAELNRRANQLAHSLLGLGVRPDTLVGLFLDRSLEMMVGLLGVLKAGGAYVPLDPYHPASRLAHMVRDANLSLIVTRAELLKSLPEGVEHVICLDRDAREIGKNKDTDPGSSAGPGNLAYVIYTSGSTGNPKGVLIEHRALVNYATGVTERLGLAGLSFAMVQPLAVDSSVTAIYPPLFSGGCVHLISRETALAPDEFHDYFGTHPVDCLKIAPSHLAALAEDQRGPLLPRRKLILGGEASRTEWVRQLALAGKGCEIYNHYGPTETTVGVTTYAVPAVLDDTPATLPIGRPLLNTQVYVLDEHMRPVPAGAPGGLYVGGENLARGYLNLSEATAANFVPNPFGSGRLYRTGDSVRVLPDGNLEFLGRGDGQVKVRGYRVEIGEVEAAILRHPAIADVAVISGEFSSGGTALAAFVITKKEARITAPELRRWLTRKLPGPMVPSLFRFLPSLPRTEHGKLDRRALAELLHSVPKSPKSAVQLGDETERRLRGIWQETLDVPEIDADDNFFDLGGHSLLAVTLFSRIEQEFGVKLALAELFRSPTIRQLAHAIRSLRTAPEWSSLVPIQPDGSRPPLFLIHGNGGNVLFYRPLAQHLGPDQPVYGLQSKGLDGRTPPIDSVEEMAAAYLEEVRRLQPDGPYHFAGYCLGAYVAHEMARQVQIQGGEIAFLGVFTTDGTWKTIRSLRQGIQYHASRISHVELPRKIAYFQQRLLYRLKTIQTSFKASIGGFCLSRLGTVPAFVRQEFLRARNVHANRLHHPGVFHGKLTYFHGSGDKHYHPELYWGPTVTDGIEFHEVPGQGISIFHEPDVIGLAREFRAALDRAGERDVCAI